MEISNEMRARIMHVYHNSNVLWAGNTYNAGNWVAQYPTLLHASKLLLTPLSEITDEHLVKVAKICDMKENFGKTLAEIGRDILGFHYQTSPLMMCSDGYALWIANIMPYHIVEAVDYLRSKSCHVPYMGIDLFEAGFAVEIKSEGGGDE